MIGSSGIYPSTYCICLNSSSRLMPAGATGMIFSAWNHYVNYNHYYAAGWRRHKG
jgi:hypothetical protein